jgi:hypothetical protein
MAGSKRRAAQTSMPITKRSGRFTTSAFHAPSSGPFSVASAGVRWKCMPERSTTRFGWRASSPSSTSGVLSPPCARMIVAEGTAVSAASSAFTAAPSSSSWTTTGVLCRAATCRIFTNAASAGLRSILRLTWRRWTSPTARAPLRPSSASSRPAAAGAVGSGRGWPGTTRSGYLRAAAAIHAASSFWTPPTPSSTTFVTLWRVMAAT